MGGVQRRGVAPSAATPGWAAGATLSRSASSSSAVGWYRPDLRCRGPWRASQFARRAASSNISSFFRCSSSLVLAKAESPVVRIPMIALVHDGLVDSRQEVQPAVKPASHVGFWNCVSSRRNPYRDSAHCKFGGWDLDEVERNAVSSVLPVAARVPGRLRPDERMLDPPFGPHPRSETERLGRTSEQVAARMWFFRLRLHQP
jgi:hypothetical protein